MATSLWRRFAPSALALCGLCGLWACGAEEKLECTQLVLSDEATFNRVWEVMNTPGKDCAGCHNSDTPVYGLDFSNRASAYDALKTKMHLIYPQLASGEMPQGGQAWSHEDLQRIRTWYCDGAYYEAEDGGAQ